MMDDATYQQYIDRLSKIHPVEVKSIAEDGQTLVPGVTINGGIIHDLIIYPHTLDQQQQLVASQIMWWGSLLGRAKRVWQITDREYAIWKAKRRLELEGTDNPHNEGKKVTKAAAEDMYRQEPDYLTLNIACERAEEAYNVCEIAVEAFKAKQWMLNRDAKRANDQSY